jgi:hypothetical protein
MGIAGVKLVSGGQTGADRAALDFALAHGIPHGGWCPAGRRAEDGPIAGRYDLKETPDSNYEQRTEWNVRDSDGTVVFSIEPTLHGGTQLTLSLAVIYRKPVLHLFQRGGPASPEAELRRFLVEHRIATLNVAGPRASEEPAVGAFVREVLERAWESDKSD